MTETETPDRYAGRVRDLMVRWDDLCTDTLMTWVGDLITELDRRGHGVHRGDVPAVPCQYAEIRPDERGRWRPVYWDEISAELAQRVDGEGWRVDDPGSDPLPRQG